MNYLSPTFRCRLATFNTFYVCFRKNCTDNSLFTNFLVIIVQRFRDDLIDFEISPWAAQWAPLWSLFLCLPWFEYIWTKNNFERWLTCFLYIAGAVKIKTKKSFIGIHCGTICCISIFFGMLFCKIDTRWQHTRWTVEMRLIIIKVKGKQQMWCVVHLCAIFLRFPGS